MNENEKETQERVFQKPKVVWMLLLCITGILINLLGAEIAAMTGIPLFIDTIGTVLTAVLGGYLPGIFTGFLTNLFKGVIDASSIYYGVLHVIIAVCASFLTRRGYFKQLHKAFFSVFLFSVIGGIIGSIQTWFLYGFATEGISVDFAKSFYEHGISNRFLAQLLADYVIDLADKFVTVLFVFFVLKLLPEQWKERFQFEGWQQTPLSREAKKAAKGSQCRSVSLRTKILLVLTLASLSIGVAATGISFVLYRDSVIEESTYIADGVARLAASVIDAEQVDTYMEQGEKAEGYLETEKNLYSIRESSPDIKYVYIYKIMEDGCHVVFDLDTEDTPGSEPGEIIPFDDAFRDQLQKLFAGKNIDPVISNESYGWLLTVYQPVYDASGTCRCYAAVDLSMDQLKANEYSFITKLISLFLGFFIMILAIGWWLAEYNIILPVNTMALSASAFAYNSEEAREQSVDRIRELDIHTGDEVENLYRAFVKTTEDSMKYVADIQNKTETISQMQNGLIMVLADVVESRDKCTGDHIRKTAAYTEIIMEEMKKRGFYTEELTDEFISDVINSAPLHDVGKIHVPDAILNKPGRLTDEEFTEMKAHTTAGSEILSKAIDIVPDSGYLNEAKNLAEYHHERWDGKGYPTGLAGEDIPLSARIMAVADVFDALISRRSYKKPFPFQKAMDIIREGAGSQFDAKVAEAFLGAEEEVRKVAVKFGELEDEE